MDNEDEKIEVDGIEIDGIDNVDVELEDVGTVLNVEDYKKEAEDKEEIVSLEIEGEIGEKSEAETLDSDEEEDLSDEERKKLGKRAQRRISQLVKRAKEAEEATAVLEGRLAESEQRSSELQVRTSSREKELLTEHEERVLAQEKSILHSLRAHKETGDLDAEVGAQDDLMQLKAEKMLIERAKSQLEVAERNKEERAALVNEEGNQPRQQAMRPDRHALRWQKKNIWFGGDGAKDRLMTQTAVAAHNELLEEGYFPDPKDREAVEDYYLELDRRIKDEFPEEFEEGFDEDTVSVRSKKKPTQAVTGGTRTSGRARAKNKVTLSKSQVMMAKRLGVSPEAYAREQLKLRKEA